MYIHNCTWLAERRNSEHELHDHSLPSDTSELVDYTAAQNMPQVRSLLQIADSLKKV